MRRSSRLYERTRGQQAQRGTHVHRLCPRALRTPGAQGALSAPKAPRAPRRKHARDRRLGRAPALQCTYQASVLGFLKPVRIRPCSCEGPSTYAAGSARIQACPPRAQTHHCGPLHAPDAPTEPSPRRAPRCLQARAPARRALGSQAPAHTHTRLRSRAMRKLDAQQRRTGAAMPRAKAQAHACADASTSKRAPHARRGAVLWQRNESRASLYCASMRFRSRK
jgi:hypothetical protein